MASSLVLTTSSHVLTFHPSSCAESGGTVDTPFYILESRTASSSTPPSANPSAPVTAPSSFPVNASSSSVNASSPNAVDLTVHDTISIDEDLMDSDRLLLKLQDKDIGSIPKSDASDLAEFVLAWRSALAALEEQVQVSQQASFEDPLSSDYVTTRLVQEHDSFIDEKTVQIRLVTWNLHGESIGEDLRPLLYGKSVLTDSGDLQDLGIFLVGLQEADPLTPTALSTNHATVSRWSQQILDALGPSSYVAIASAELLGMVLLMFCHRKLASQITNIQIATAGTGVLGYWGNKGSVCLKFTLGENEIAGNPGIEFAVLNMHLSSGMAPQSVERRRWEMSEFEKRLKLPKFNGKLYRKTRNGGKNRKELLFQNGDLLQDLDERVLDAADEDDADALAAATAMLQDAKISESSSSEDAPGTPSTLSGKAMSTASTTATTVATATSETATTAATINSDQVGPEREFNSIVFVLGDLNYRIAMDRSDIEQLVRKGDYDALLFWDQLRNEIKEESLLVGFQEGPIDFPPTYKYDIGTTTFDTSEKMRIPAYTDRIFYTPYPSLAQLDYESFMHYISSDHKPVAATFELRTMLVDVDKRAQIVKRLLRDMDARENESRPKVEVESTEIVCPDLKPLSVLTRTIKFKNHGNTQVAWEIEQMDGSKLEFGEMRGLVSPGAGQSIRFSMKIPTRVSEISEIVVLRIVNRQDYFVTVSGNVLPSCYGSSLQDMIDRPNGARNGFVVSDSGPQVNIPREIWKCVDYLSKRISKDIFRRQGDDVVGQLIRDWLDDGVDFDTQILDSLQNEGNKGFQSVCEQFMLLLELVDGGVIVESAYDIVCKGEDGVSLIFEAMPRVNINTLICIASFLREVKQTVIDFGLILERFDEVLVRIPPKGKNKSKQKKKRMEFFKAFIG
ncbi:Endonuclease/exonuclease/phosphatase [Myxozyma melibiosi]|uniref:Endonuclease/exonuclease/phosphatase n=1 Tax=Myxozyma melibiosi TaxID=54550 RepID=A0ABR1F119_9ASCO